MGSGSWCLGGAINQCPTATFNPSFNMFGLEHCRRCLAGHYCGEGEVYPRPCAPGSYAEAGAESCTPCAQGHYQSATGASACVLCESNEAGSSEAMTTNATGATSMDECICKEGYFDNRTIESRSEAVSNRSISAPTGNAMMPDCLRCVIGTECALSFEEALPGARRKGTTVYTLPVRRGFWRPSAESTDVRAWYSRMDSKHILMRPRLSADLKASFADRQPGREEKLSARLVDHV